MPIEVVKLIEDPRLKLGIVEIAGGKVGEASADLRATGVRLAEKVGAEDYEIPEDKRKAVRQLLKIGGFSPSGRNRPAHELLVRDIKERGEFNHINNVVDVNNVTSIENLVPISIFDRDKVGDRLIIRIGEPDEGYVFNQSGHQLDVKRCICCCRNDGDAGEPIGTPVKDSMETKIFEGASRYLGVMYFTTDGWSSYEMIGVNQKFANLLEAETGGYIVTATVR